MSDTAAAPAQVSRATPQDPWLGLESYSEAESAWFFGRDAERDELLRVIERDLLTVVYGPSGSGKTSLLSAGVFPLLRKKHYLPIRIRLEHGREAPKAVTQIKQRLFTEVTSRNLKESPLFDPLTDPAGETLWEYLHRVDFWDPAIGQFITPVILLDQFEELFTLGSARKDELLDDLVALLEDAKSGPRYKLILTLRQEYLYLLDPLRRRAPAFMHNRYLLGPMNGESALQAVLKPGAEVVTSEVADQVVRFVVGGKTDPLNELEVEPVLLSLFCRELNEGRRSRRAAEITAKQLEAEQSDILNNFYESSFAGLDPATRPFIEDRLLTSAGNRTSAPEDDATHAKVPPADLDQLESRRLIRREQHLQRPHLELTHDILTKPAAESRRIRRERQSAAESAKQLAESRKRQRILIGLVVVSLISAVTAGLLYWKAITATRQAETERANAFRSAEKERDASKAAGKARDEADLSATDARKQREIAEQALQEALAQKKLAEASASEAQAQKVRAETFARDAQNATGVARQQTDLANERAKQLDEQYTRALRLSREARAREFAAYARESLESNPLRSLALALFAADATRSGSDPILPVAEDLLHRSLMQSKLLAVLPATDAQSVAYSPDGRFIVTAGTTVPQIWNSTSGELLVSLKGHTREVTNAQFSGDSKYVITGGWDGTVRLWDATGRQTSMFDAGQTVESVALSPDGKLVAAGVSGQAVLWDRASGQRIPPIPAPLSAGVKNLSFSSDSHLLLFSTVNYVSVWSLTPRREVRSFSDEKPVVKAAFTSDPDLIFTANSKATGMLRQLSSGSAVRTFQDSTEIRSSSISPEGSLMALGDRLWDAITGLSSRLLGVSTLDSAFTSDGTTIVVADGRQAQVFDATPGREIQVLRLHSIADRFEARFLTFSPDNSRLVVVGEKEAYVWDLPSRKRISVLKVELTNPIQADFSADGERVILRSSDGQAQIWHARTGESLQRSEIAVPRVLLPRSAADELVISSGVNYACTTEAKSFSVWKLSSTPERLFTRAASGPCLTFNADGSLLLLAGLNGPTLWDVQSQTVRRILSSDRLAPTSHATFTPDGRRIITTDLDGGLHVWETASRRETVTAAPHTSDIQALRVSPDGKLLATVGDDGLLQILTIDVDLLLDTARQRLQRTRFQFAPVDCQRYFQSTSCPPLP